MLSSPSHDLNLVVSHTTAAASSVSDWVARHYGLPVQKCYLIRRNLNDNYAVGHGWQPLRGAALCHPAARCVQCGF